MYGHGECIGSNLVNECVCIAPLTQGTKDIEAIICLLDVVTYSPKRGENLKPYLQVESLNLQVWRV